MYFYHRYIRPLYFGKRFYRIFVSIIALFILSYAFPPVFPILKIGLLIFALLVLFDYLLMFKLHEPVIVIRDVPERFSNGDENEVLLNITRNTSFALHGRIIDEVPIQFQKREFDIPLSLKDRSPKVISYLLRPTERGEYVFNDINVFLKSPLALVIRRHITQSKQSIKVYPSFFTLRHFELLAYSNALSEHGSRKIRKIGHSLEFEQIREYVAGDDIRSINWKATARKGGNIMVNNYTDERSQQVYCIIDKGRVMKMPFRQMTLMDYAINATLILSRVALLKQDKAGLITFAEDIGTFVPADRKGAQMTSIMETLYNQKTGFHETDYSNLHALIRTRITQRSFFILFSNFESMSGLERQLPFIRGIARNHLVLVVFFENTELKLLTESRVKSIESLYIRTIAEKFVHEKKLMVKELQQHGIFTILTAPENLTIDTVNKYLELKARQAI